MASTELNCLFCKESFEDRKQLQIHFRKHGDPKFNQNVKSNKSVSENDSNINTEVSNDASETVNCDVCEDVFPTISKAITHKHKMHPDHDAKYFCPWCGKLFTMKHLYNKHIEKNHTSDESNGSGFHCDYCDVDFFAAAAMIYHNKFFHRQDTELASIGYSKKMKHFDQEVLPIYYCPFCGEEYINKVNLHKHMGDDHIDENQSPDDVLRCPLCEAVFYHLDAYELHLTFHSDTDLYSEKNDIVKSITEFSLEAVPPLMEKVENEVQEDAEANMSSMGIENFLQQAMNESNDNSNSLQTISHKKKKHKKHKKSKKATITLDEFLSMNTDVFGEGIDLQVQGIEEVPSQVVAKQLRKPMNMKKRPTAMQSKEIEKLRKQGIVIKKNTCNSNKANEITMKVNSVSAHKLPSMPQAKPALRSTDDLINKLMSQGNSQIKIVKKASQNSNSESDTGSGPPNNFDTKNDTQKTMETEDHEPQGNHDMTELRPDKGHKSPIQEEIEVGDVDLSKPIPLKWKDDPPFRNGSINNQDKHTGSKSAVDVLKSISQHITIKPMTKSGTGEIKHVIDEKSDSEAKISDEISRETKNNKNLDALKRLGLTVKSVNQAQNQSLAIPLKSDSPVVEDNSAEYDSKTVKGNLVESPKERKDNQCPESPNMLALKNISKNITVKSPTTKLSQKVHSDMSGIESKEVPVDSDSKNTNNKRIKIMQGHLGLEKKPEINSEVLKNISKHITVRASNKSLETADTHSEDEHMENFEEDEMKNCDRNPQIKSPNVIKDQSQSKSLDALKNLSKYITIKAASKSLIETDEMNSEDENMEKFEEHEINTEIAKKLLHSSNRDIQSKSLKVVSNQSQTKSLDALKHLSKDITIKSPNKTMIDTSEDKNIDEDEFEAQGNKNDEILKNVQESPLSTKAIQSPNNSSKSIDALKNLSKHITIKAPNQSISKQDTGSDHEDQDDINTNKRIVIKKDEKLKELGRTNETSQKMSKSLDVLKNLGKNITIKSPNNKTDDYEDDSDISVSKNLMKGQNLKSPDKIPTLAHHFKSPEIRKVSLNPQMPNKSLQTTAYLDKATNSQIVEKQPASELDPQIVKNQSLDIMKNFPNITAKSLSATNTKKCVKQQVSSSQSMSIVKGRTLHKKCVKTEQTSEEIETYNIDDSEDEETLNMSEEHCKLNTSNDEAISKIQNRLENTDSNIIVETPSDNENEDVDNIEDQIQPSIISKKAFTECSAGSENQLVKHVNQNPRLKSMHDFNFDDDAEDENPDCNQKVLNTLFNRQTNQSKSNSSQIINKEVRTVQTFQSETVIEEITTTVTKTIRTVNQAVKHESRGQNPGVPQIRPKFQGTTNLPQTNNYRGIQVRQSRPTMGAQMRHFGPRTRPGMIRPNAPIRQTVPRAPNTRMPAFRQNLRAPNAQKIETRPMKIAPNAIVASAKRPSQEPPGHFSCFKKPKESLIPVLDVPSISMAMNKTNNAAQQVKISAQMTKSNYSTTTKVIKGNSVMTSTQNKSEMMIERLQSMGLLVKKPKVDDSAQDDDDYNVPSDDEFLDDGEQ